MDTSEVHSGSFPVDDVYHVHVDSDSKSRSQPRAHPVVPQESQVAQQDNKTQAQALRKFKVNNEGFKADKVGAPHKVFGKATQFKDLTKAVRNANIKGILGTLAKASAIGLAGLIVVGVGVPLILAASPFLVMGYVGKKAYEHIQDFNNERYVQKKNREWRQSFPNWEAEQKTNREDYWNPQGIFPRELDHPADGLRELSNFIGSLDQGFKMCKLENRGESVSNRGSINSSQDSEDQNQSKVNAKQKLKEKLEGIQKQIDDAKELIIQLKEEGKTVDRQVKNLKGLYREYLKVAYEARGKKFKDRMFKDVCAIERGSQAETMTNKFAIDGVKFKEEATPLSTDAGLQYLQNKTANKSNMTLGPCCEQLQDAAGIRPSELKKTPEVQAMTINGFEHTLSVDGQEVSGVLRSGAFAVHGRRDHRVAELEVPLAELNKELAQLKKLEKNLSQPQNIKDSEEKTVLEKNKKKEIEAIKEKIKLAKKGPEHMGLHALKKNLAKIKAAYDKSISSPEATEKLKEEAAETRKKAVRAMGFDSIEDMEQEIETRQTLVVAQALPKLVRSVQRMTQDKEALKMAEATGNFLHVEESYLSHLNEAEKAMIEDMKGAMDHLRDNCVIILDPQMKTDDEPKIESDAKDPNKIIIRMYQPEAAREAEGADKEKTFGLSALFFTSGVNEMQTKGHHFQMHDALQDEINADGLNHLYAYAGKAQEKSPGDLERSILVAKRDIREHYSSATNRDLKDMDGLELRRSLVNLLHGGKGVICKSGKDRTAGGVSNDLARDAKVKSKHIFNDDDLMEKLFAGISHKITGLNLGTKNGYCFNVFQRRFIPKKMLPDSKLCGASES